MSIVLNQSVVPIPKFDTYLEKLEYAARVCYLSFGKKKDGSAVKLFKHLYNSGHWSVFEHLWVEIKLNKLYAAGDLYDGVFADTQQIQYILTAHPHFCKFIEHQPDREYSIAANLRTLLELYRELDYNKLLTLILHKFLGIDGFQVVSRHECEEFLQSNTLNALSDKLVCEFDDYLTVEVVTNRAIANEMERHRVLSPSQESTRYVNYNNKPMRFIIPYGISDVDSDEYRAWFEAITEAENRYLSLLRDYKWPPQKARGILPLDLATTVVFTATRRQWEDCLKKRTNSDVHPQAVEVAETIAHILGKRPQDVAVDIKVDDCEVRIR
jgi:thymidylate synthase ThyX